MLRRLVNRPFRCTHPFDVPRRPVWANSRREADASGAHDPLVIGDVRDNDVKWAVLRLESDDGGAAATAAQRRLEGVGGPGLDEGGDDLAARKSEFDANALVRQQRPPPKGPRGRNRD